MTLMILSEPVPLQTDAEGAVRVSGTRVTLDTIVTVFQRGATAEEIAQQYPAVPLADVYDVIAYYLRNKSAVEEYLKENQAAAEGIRAKWESRGNVQGLRERLLARRKD